MAISKTRTYTNMGNGATANRVWRLKKNAVSITSWSNHTTGAYAFETLTTSGETISSAINTSSYGVATTNSISCTGGRIYRVKMTLTLNSGTIPYFRMVSSKNSGSWSLASTVTAGTYTYSLAKAGTTIEYWFCPTSTGTYYLELASLTTSNFAVSAFSVDEWTPTLISNTVAYDYFEDTADVGDAILFGIPYLAQMPHALWFEIGTALSASSITTEWKYSQADVDKYYNEATSAHSITLAPLTVTDNTNSFQTTGQQTVEWTPPKDMGVAYLSALNAYASVFIICEITAVTSLTEGGANATNASKTAIDSIDYTTYTTGTVTSTGETSGRTYRIFDTSKNWALGELRGRYVWFTSGNASPVAYMIRDNGQTHIDIGFPHYIYLTQGATMPLVTNAATNDTYAVSHTMEDIRLADVAGSWGLITGTDWITQWKKYKNYYSLAPIIARVSSPNFGLFSTWGESIGFNYSYGMSISGTGSFKFCSGVRSIGYDSSGSAKLSEEITMLGSEIWFNTYGYTAAGSGYYRGDVYSTKFLNTVKSSYCTYIYPQGDFRNVMIDGPQMQNVTLALTGYNMLHFPSESNRNPTAGLFKLRGYKNSGGTACLYATNAGNFYLDNPYTDTYYAFQSYNPWVSGYYADIINKHPDTPYGFNTALAGGTTSGMWRFYYTVNFHICDENGDPIEGATITVKNGSDTTEFTDTTDANGEATNNTTDGDYPVGNKIFYGYKQTSTAGYSTGLTGTYGPFGITITKGGYETYIDNCDISEKSEYKITLKKAIPVLTTQSGQVVVKVDPKNTGANRGIGIII